MRAACRWVLIGCVIGCAGTQPPPKQPATNAPLTEQEAQARPAPPPPPPPPSPPPPPPAQVEPANPVIASDLGRLSADSEIVFAVDVARLRQGALWARYAPSLAKYVGSIGELAKSCGIDPLASVTTIAGGIQGMGDATRGVVVVHGLAGADVRACIPTLRKQLAKLKAKLTIDHDLFEIQIAHGAEITLGLVDDATLIIAFGSRDTKWAWNAARAETSSVRDSPSFLALYHRISPSAPAIVLVGGGPVLTKLSTVGMRVVSCFGSFDASDSLSADMRFRFATADEAAQLTTLMKGQLAQAKQFFDKIDVSNDDVDLHLEAAMTQAKLDALLAMMSGAKP